MSDNQTAVSVYSQDGMDDFPVLKAFQQYIDSEQAKARKRLVMLGIFFCILIGAVISVFVAMLASVTARNQQLNDRLVEFAMKERSQPSAIVHQPSQDNAIILAMTAKIDEMQKKLDESRAKADKDAAVAAERERARLAAEKERARMAAQQTEAKPKAPSVEELEIKRLNTLLEIERQKAAAEKERRLKEEAAAKERRRQEELEAYRRRQYPELYTPKPAPAQPAPVKKAVPAKPAKTAKTQNVDAEIDAIVAELDNDDSDSGAISYFDAEEQPVAKPKATPRKRAAKPAPVVSKPKEEEKPEDTYKIPVEVKSTGRRWHVPVE